MLAGNDREAARADKHTNPPARPGIGRLRSKRPRGECLSRVPAAGDIEIDTVLTLVGARRAYPIVTYNPRASVFSNSMGNSYEFPRTRDVARPLQDRSSWSDIPRGGRVRPPRPRNHNRSR